MPTATDRGFLTIGQGSQLARPLSSDLSARLVQG
jgi:hypothetical protein